MGSICLLLIVAYYSKPRIWNLISHTCGVSTIWDSMQREKLRVLRAAIHAVGFCLASYCKHSWLFELVSCSISVSCRHPKLTVHTLVIVVNVSYFVGQHNAACTSTNLLYSQSLGFATNLYSEISSLLFRVLFM